MKKGIVPRPAGIDTDARWGYSHTNEGWVFGYKLHLTCTTTTTAASGVEGGEQLVVPLTAADVTTTANVPDNKMYVPLTSSLLLWYSLYPPYAIWLLIQQDMMIKNCTDIAKRIGNRLGLSSVERYESTPKKRLELVCFYESVLGQAIYKQRGISIEPLIEHIKSVFRIDPLPVYGFNSVSATVLLSVLLYQITVYYNCKTHKLNPKSIKYMLGTG